MSNTKLINLLLLVCFVVVTARWSSDEVFAPGSQLPTPAELQKCFDDVVLLTGFDMSQQTNVNVLKDILTNDMELFGMPEVQQLFASDLARPQSLVPFLLSIRRGITEVQPAIGVTLCCILDEKKGAYLALNNSNLNILNRVVQHTFLLDKLTEKLAQDLVFMEKTVAYLKKVRLEITGRTSELMTTFDSFRAAGLFGAAKDLTVKEAMEQIMVFRKQGNATAEQCKSRAKTMSLNVLEATATDFAKGFFDNSRVGKMLLDTPLTQCNVVGPNREIYYGLSSDWNRLYETWNSAFVTGILDYHHIVLPKLLTPRVLLDVTGSYMYNRAIALWLSIDFYLMAAIKKTKSTVIFNKKQVSAVWGKINLKYGNYLKSIRPL